MKRHNNLFDQIVSYENLELAYQRAKKGKIRERRLTLVRATQNTLKESLETLGIDAIHTM